MENVIQSAKPVKRNLILITSYPPRNTLHGKKVSGMASFAKNTITSMTNSKFVVLAQITNQPEEYFEDDNKIIRCWDKHKFSLYFNILRQLIKHRTFSKKILLEFEFGIYGEKHATAKIPHFLSTVYEKYITGLMPLFLALLRLLGYDITVVIHQALQSFSELSPHIGIEEKGTESRIVNLLLQLYYKMLGFFANRIITLDEIHKQKLSKNINPRKITVIPHGVENIDVPATQKIKPKHDNIFNILVFGFVAWYKGTDWIVEEFARYLKNNPDNPNHIKLTIAGGESPTLGHFQHYQQYYSSIEQTIKNLGKNAELTGFIPEEEISKYFNSADLVVFPYRVLMSSSGPLSLALAYEKPFLMSNNLRPYLQTKDFTDSLDKSKVNPGEICFKMDDNELFTRINTIAQKPEQLTKIQNISQATKLQRNWNILGKLYEKTIP